MTDREARITPQCLLKDANTSGPAAQVPMENQGNKLFNENGRGLFKAAKTDAVLHS
jgi:hypothetical protein